MTGSLRRGHKIPGVEFASPEWLPRERITIVSCTAHQQSKLSLLTGFVAATVDGHFFDPGTVTYASKGVSDRAIAERFITGKMRPSTTNGCQTARLPR
jgi:hypothetical protein